ncbi:MAG: HAD family phosphatase [Planctomycetes bacterium]|nr:HAD family phosphatase [Planctomycetota bacterium]
MSDSNTRIGVVFDMDGVLVDSAEPHFRSWQLLGAGNAVDVSREQFSSTFGRQNNDIVPLLFGEVSPERLRQLSDRKEILYRDLIHAQVPIVDGAPELVRSLHAAGVAVGVGSSGPLANIRMVLEAMAIQDCISAIVSGDDVTRGKPHPEVFSLTFAKMGIDPARGVIIEDAPVGVQAARVAGAYVVAVLIYHPREAFDQADCFVDRLSRVSVAQLTSLLQRPRQANSPFGRSD